MYHSYKLSHLTTDGILNYHISYSGVKNAFANTTDRQVAVQKVIKIPNDVKEDLHWEMFSFNSDTFLYNWSCFILLTKCRTPNFFFFQTYLPEPWSNYMPNEANDSSRLHSSCTVDSFTTTSLKFGSSGDLSGNYS